MTMTSEMEPAPIFCDPDGIAAEIPEERRVIYPMTIRLDSI